MDDQENHRDERGEKPLLDIFKKIIKTGSGALELTEEGLKNILAEVRLPGEFLNQVQSRIEDQLIRTKEGLLEIAGKEVRKWVDKFDPTREIEKVLDRYEIEIKATINFSPKGRRPEGPKKRRGTPSSGRPRSQG